MFEKILNKYRVCGQFTFNPAESLEAKCNAPADKNGVYVLYKIDGKSKEILYIGCSGGKDISGHIKTRTYGVGGLKDRIVNGYDPKFGKVKRKKSWPSEMIKQGITEILVEWHVTYDGATKDFPNDVQEILYKKYYSQYNQKPPWHK